jgi:putative membrane protein
LALAHASWTAWNGTPSAEYRRAAVRARGSHVAPHTTMARTETVLARAQFDPRLSTYFFLQALFFLTVTFITIPLIVVWIFVGPGFHRRQYEALSCELTTRTLHVKRGVLFRVQQNIPLDKITDLALVEGPLLRHLGLCALRIETAGGGQATSTGQAMLVGVTVAEKFRDQVLAQRDAVVFDGGAASAMTDVQRAAPSATLDELCAEVRRGNALLGEMLGELRRPRGS